MAAPRPSTGSFMFNAPHTGAHHHHHGVGIVHVASTNSLHTVSGQQPHSGGGSSGNTTPAAGGGGAVPLPHHPHALGSIQPAASLMDLLSESEDSTPLQTPRTLNTAQTPIAAGSTASTTAAALAIAGKFASLQRAPSSTGTAGTTGSLVPGTSVVTGQSPAPAKVCRMSVGVSVACDCS